VHTDWLSCGAYIVSMHVASDHMMIALCAQFCWATVMNASVFCMSLC